MAEIDDCLTCDPGTFGQIVFLGVSVKRFNASLGYGAQVSELTVELVEDDCTTPKYYYNECGNLVNTTSPNPGFFGEKRFQRGDGSTYSACAAEDISHTLIRDAINIVGGPVYFRANSTSATFEFAGIVSDWIRTNDPTSPPSYQVKIVDPRIILQGVQLIIGDYGGRIDQAISVLNGGNGCPTTNLFNVFGFAEQFGNFCPPYTQCYPGIYEPVANHVGNDFADCPGFVTDGEIFGTWMGGFAGSYWNESGMSLRAIIDAFNVLANSVTPIANAWSPYGRVIYYSYDIPGALSGTASGLIQEDAGTGCAADKCEYYVDMSAVPIYDDSYYRVPGTTITLLDLLQKLSEDFNFDFYVDLLLVKTGTTPCLAKFIKVNVIYRTGIRPLGEICSYIENTQCVVQSSIGIELRPENNSKFVIGAPKQMIYQAEQHSNPDALFTSPANDADEIASLNNVTNDIDIVSGYSTIDDTIMDYFGLDEFDNALVPGAISFKRVELPTGKLNASLQYLRFPSGYITVSYQEMLASLRGFDAWASYIQDSQTQTWQYGILLFSNWQALRHSDVRRDVNGNLIIRNAKNPKLIKGFQWNFNVSVADRTVQERRDINAVYQWVYSYARDYLGKKFAVRVPFTCAAYDAETNRIRISELPTNDGGWTEMPTVLGLPNFGNLSYGRLFDGLNMFRDDLGKIRCFVRFNDPALMNLFDLNKEDYTYYAEVDGGETGSGPPLISTPGNIYTDTTNGNVYLKDPILLNWSASPWVHITQYNGVFVSDDSSPPGFITSLNPPAPRIYLMCRTTDGAYWAAEDYGVDGVGNMTGITWVPMVYRMFMKAEVQEDYVFHDKSTYFGPRVVVTIPQAMRRRALYTDDPSIPPDVVNLDDFEFAIGDPRSEPVSIDAAAIPMKSNTLSYGPWYNPADGANTEVIVDESLAPWNFNGYAGMNLAGALVCNEGRSNMAFEELGSVTVLGYPKLPLGAELNYTPGVWDSVDTRTRVSDFVTGTDFNNDPVSHEFHTVSYHSPWDGTFGPNVTNMTISVNEQGEVTTSYSMRSFTNRSYGLNKWIVNKLRSISSLNLKLVQDMRVLSKARGHEYGYEV